ncbi:UDP-N-acetylmuramoyl-tripeptide--D-alanyl-D-alanine ligase [Alkalimarinus alittae]|uniref:UDP-N-acetylmuramoyl-tripeptide--D-alanyl-D-alanine ligase n=1 Tax=Alkalimarinus alittae TaxID=2961619 RepID=A0ABY6N0E5_9ALTE|nr:UDP-N-acetylmuramoyl-tripeptide--D-alanyl-D-alanine ligase [Alkalimarinus alittae]UZE95563.1 UDP-N-acetylmuramoyl-tripeptide--D-alanyl-D-alanine ligase [Alkalimarinus alittae]
MINDCSLATLASITSGDAFGEDCVFRSVSTDTRSIQAGDLFVALQGPNFDGNQYVISAKEQGAVAALVDTYQDVDIPQVQVTDTLKALGVLASYNRQLFSGRIAAITGSSGKTSVKEMLAELLSEQGNTLATKGNLNNHIGAPLTLLRISEEHKFAVVELGASGVGEINYTASLAKPDVSILTNAGNAHLEGFGSYENIVQAKSEIISALDEDGVAILNADDPAFEQWKKIAGFRKTCAFSLNANAGADVWAESIDLRPNGSSFELCWSEGRVSISLPLPGEHNIANALAASSAANVLGVSWQAIKKILSELKSIKGRLELATSEQGYTVINDTYNANPSSTRAALDVLVSSNGFRVAVLGDMAELGEDAADMHHEIGLYAKDAGVDALYAFGQYAKDTVKGFGSKAQEFNSKQDLIDVLKKEIREDATYLVKGSRSSAMETIVEEMLKQKVVA